MVSTSYSVTTMYLSASAAKFGLVGCTGASVRGFVDPLPGDRREKRLVCGILWIQSDQIGCFARRQDLT